MTGANPDQFTIVSGGAPFTVAPGATHDVVVSFNPTSAGAKSASLDIASNDPDEPTVNVALTGTGVAGNIVVSSSIPSNANPFTGDAITVAINIDMTGMNPPDNLLGSFTASLNWDPTVLTYTGNSGILQGFTGFVNDLNAANGVIVFNGAKATGQGGAFDVLIVNFNVVGAGQTSTILDLNYTAMAAAFTFQNLLPFLTINDGVVTVQQVVVNNPPVLTPIPDQTMDEGTTLQVQVSATDPDGDNITLTVQNLPSFGSFQQTGNGVGVITFAPNFTHAGSYPNISVTACDDGTPVLCDADTFNLTVNNVNRAPDLQPIADQFVQEGTTVQVPVSATDPDGDVITLSIANNPAFVTLVDNGNGTGTITIAPPTGSAGPYPNIQVTATDNGTPNLSDTESFDLTVTAVAVNNPPVLTPIPDQTVAEDQTLQVPVSATDPDGDNITLTVQNLPSFGSFQQTGNGVGVITFAPNFNHAGSYPNIIVNACDDGTPVLCDADTFNLTVLEVNRAPELEPIPNQTMVEAETLEVDVEATDPDNNNIILTVQNLPSFGTLQIVSSQPGSITALIIFTPAIGDAGTYPDITVVATDDSPFSKFDTESFDLTVLPAQADNTPPDCDLLGINPGPPVTLTVRIQDNESGLASINVISAVNANVVIPPFTVGTNDPVIVVATKINQNQSSTVILEAFDVAGNSVTCDPVYTQLSSIVPDNFSLEQNYPNPFNPTTTIEFGVAAGPTTISLKIYDVTGKLVKTLINNEQVEGGFYRLNWDGTNDKGEIVAAGIYIYRMNAGNFVQTRRMMFVK